MIKNIIIVCLCLLLAWRESIHAERRAYFMKALAIMYPTGITETALNDLLWHESDFCLALVGLKDE